MSKKNYAYEYRFSTAYIVLLGILWCILYATFWLEGSVPRGPLAYILFAVGAMYLLFRAMTNKRRFITLTESSISIPSLWLPPVKDVSFRWSQIKSAKIISPGDGPDYIRLHLGGLSYHNIFVDHVYLDRYSAFSNDAAYHLFDKILARISEHSKAEAGSRKAGENRV